MADQDDVRRIALALPEVAEGDDHFSFSVANKGKARNLIEDAWRCQAPKSLVMRDSGKRNLPG